LRRPTSDITRQALEWIPQGKRKVRRPVKTWRRSVEEELKQANITWNAAIIWHHLELPQTESACAVQCPPFVPQGTQRSNYYLLTTGFHLDINNLTRTLRKNLFPSSIIENVVRKFLNNYFTPDSFQSVARKDNCLYFKLPYIGPFSILTQRRIKTLVTTFCSVLQIKLVFTSFKIRSWYGAKDSTVSLRVCDRESFISFHVQAVVPVILVKLIDTSPLASVNIWPPANIPTSLST